MFIAIKLAKEGYFNGNPSNVLQAQADIVLNVLRFEAEDSKYKNAHYNLNKGDK